MGLMLLPYLNTFAAVVAAVAGVRNSRHVWNFPGPWLVDHNVCHFDDGVPWVPIVPDSFLWLLIQYVFSPWPRVRYTWRCD